jgi:general stress protein 26
VLWFFTDWESSKVVQLTADTQIALGYAEPRKQTFVSVSGTGTVVPNGSHTSSRPRERA